MDFFYLQTHRTRNPQSLLLFQLARLVTLIGTVDTPASIAYLITHGAIYQCPLQGRQGRPASHCSRRQPPKIREIHNGCVLLKLGFRFMTRHKSCVRVKKLLSIMQYGLGFPAGPEVLAHLGRALVERGFAANTEDAIKLHQQTEHHQ